MPNYLAPDVYVEEVPGGARPIEAVGTSTAGFVGVAPNGGAFVNEARAINNWTEFVKEFWAEGNASTPLSQAVYGFFLNGGRRCYVVNVGPNNPVVGAGNNRAGLQVLEQIDEVAIVAIPGFTDAASYDAARTHCELLQDRVAILDTPEVVPDIDSLTRVATVPVPGGGGGSPEEQPGVRGPESSYATQYYPWITGRDPITNQIVNMPPSGHIAGIWARSDATRGVHKAPANEPVRGALNVTYLLTRDEQGVLNQNGVNAIRFFPNAGIQLWGARTLAESSSEWRYLNVRRLFNMIEESIAENTRWIVFEPNDQTLWKSIRRDIGEFLTRIWRDGALMGSTPEEAFFVKCDEETNPPDVIDAGMVVTLVGIAPVKPAEFVVFRISQWAGGTQVETQGGQGA
jgi:phage tail sheath protein FI